MPGHPHTDAWALGAAGDIADSAETYFVFVALTASDITARDLERVRAVILLTDDGYRFYKYDADNVDAEDGVNVIWDSEDRPFVLSASPFEISLATFAVVIDGGGAEIVVGQQVDIGPIPFACSVIEASVVTDATGSIVVDIWRAPYADLPPTDADTITASAPPTVSAGVKSKDTTLTGWTTALAQGDWLRLNVDSVSGVSRATVSLLVRRPI